MKDLIRNNLGMKILSVVIAVLIWFLVSSSNDPVVTRRYTGLAVTMINGDTLTESGMAYNVESGDTVDIVVKGNKSIINNISKSDFVAEADLSQLTKWGTAEIQVSSLKYNDRLDISLGSVQVVTVNVEEVSTKSVKVVVNTVDEPADGYVIGSTSSSPSLIDVEGPQSKVEKIASISVDLNVSESSENVSEKISSTEFVLYDESGEEISQDQLNFGQKSLKASARILKKKEISIKLSTKGSPGEGYSLVSLEYEPKKITVVGKEEDLEDLSAITPDPISLEGLTKTSSDEIQLTNEFLKGETGKDIQKYDDSVDAISVKAVIEKTETRKISFKSSDIEVRNNDNNYKVTFSKHNYSITVEGAGSVVKALKIKDFEPYINLESIELSDDVESEEHTMNFHYTEPDKVYVTSSPESTITVTVSR